MTELLLAAGMVLGRYGHTPDDFEHEAMDWARSLVPSAILSPGEKHQWVDAPQPVAVAVAHPVYPEPIRGTVGLSSWWPGSDEPLWCGYLILRLEPGHAARASEALDIALGGAGESYYAETIEEIGCPALVGGYLHSSMDGLGDPDEVRQICATSAHLIASVAHALVEIG